MLCSALENERIEDVMKEVQAFQKAVYVRFPLAVGRKESGDSSPTWATVQMSRGVFLTNDGIPGFTGV